MKLHLILSLYSLHVQCKYKGTKETGLQINVTVYTAPPPPPASDDGILKLELRIAKGIMALGNGDRSIGNVSMQGVTGSCVCLSGGNYRSWYVDSDYPIQSILQDPVFVEVRVQDRMDPMIVLRLHNCWATPVPAPNHEVQWSLLVDG